MSKYQSCRFCFILTPFNNKNERECFGRSSYDVVHDIATLLDDISVMGKLAAKKPPVIRG
ncbi:hypothetical protein ACNKHP_24235 [Shigella boydii]